MNTIKPIRTKKDYKQTLLRVEELITFNPPKGTAAYDELDVLGTLLSVYEDVHFPISAPDPVEVVKLTMEENGLKPIDLSPLFGSKGVVSEFLNHKRSLSIKTIKALHTTFGLPYELLIA